MPCVNSQLSSRAPALLRQCRVLRGSAHGSRKYPNCFSNRGTESFFVVCFCHSFPRPWQTAFGFKLATCIWDWYASDNKFVELRLIAGRSRKRAVRPQPSLDGHAVPWPWEDRHGRGWHGRGMASVNQTRPHCVNQMGKTHSKPLAARHGRGTAWARHFVCESAFTYCQQELHESPPSVTRLSQ